ncbi:MAG: methionine--tRNA ligase [Crocinitomicaceae bacterium]|nr:methionine--tRNA ligase [Crocinitomicaceae bacterium]
MNQPQRYLVTAALPYANGPLHIGHIGGAYLPSDIYVRYLKANQRDVAFICGSDEHGAAITLRAKKEGKTPREIVDHYHLMMKKAFEDFGIRFDIYHRTSSPEHHEMSREIFLDLLKKNSFETETSLQYYDEEAKQFLADRYIIGTCPNCSSDRAYGDQCENCGTALSPLELIKPLSTLSGSAPVLKETTHWYLPMAQHETCIRNFIENGTLNGVQHHDPREWKAHVLGQCMSWINGGLQSRAMTRDLDWGVPVPVEGAEGKVLYVWLDAPIGYITNTKVWADKNGKNWEDYWKKEDTRLIHFIGKDNIVFHCIIFPIILHQHGEFILPQNVPANEFMNLEGDKISTSRNWAVWLHEYLEEFPGRQDEMRYVLCSIMPEQRDSEFTWADYRDRVNNELADILGNFVNRVFVLTHKYYNGSVPPVNPDVLTEADRQARVEGISSFENTGKKIEEFRFREALSEAMNLARIGNKYLTETEPWKLIKTDPERTAIIMNYCLQLVADLSGALAPFLPFTAEKIRRGLCLEDIFWNDAIKKDQLPEGHIIGQLPILFEKISDETVAQQMAKLEASKAVTAATSKEVKEVIDFEFFQKVDIRMARIVEAEKMPKTKKLLKLKVDIGSECRTVVSGIAEHYSPEEIVGKTVLFLANLAPREIKGVKSEGMILMAENATGVLSIISPEKEMNAGDEVR